MTNGSCTKIKAKRVVPFAAGVNRSEKTVRFFDMLYVPDLCTNLISVGSITDNGYSVIFDRREDKVFDGAKKVVLVAKPANGL